MAKKNTEFDMGMRFAKLEQKIKNIKPKAPKGPAKIRLKTFRKEREKIRSLVQEEKSIYPRRLRVSQDDVQKREKIKELKKDLTTKRISSVKKFTEETTSRVSFMAAKKLKERAISRRVLKRGRATLVLKEHEPAPYIPIFFKG